MMMIMMIHLKADSKRTTKPFNEGTTQKRNKITDEIM
jgi:hypothetical protein